VQKFYRFYVVPGAGHQSPNGTSNEKASPPIFSRTGIYEYLVNWVEKGQVPGRIDLTSPDGSRSQPVCPYPQKARYTQGDPKVAASYECR
ncbi:MAG: tannase/feruloyl esterase family alpha/beta hydrolase, partial [Novosphingobium sp.]